MRSIWTIIGGNNVVSREEMKKILVLFSFALTFVAVLCVAIGFRAGINQCKACHKQHFPPVHQKQVQAAAPREADCEGS